MIDNNRQSVKGITIDGPFSKDLDDAILIEETSNGFRISVSIADVSHLVKPDSELDKEAYSKGFTLYRAWGNLPMLPRDLSEDKLSLLAGKKRPTITATIELSENLDIVSTTLARTELTSAKRYTYAQASKEMQDPKQILCGWGVLAQRLLEKRRERGALAIYDQKTGLYLNGETVTTLNQNTAHAQILVQEMMILTNQAVAEKMAATGVPFPFRNHRAIIGGKSVSIEEMQQDSNKRALFYQRARYESTNTGHIGLNLKAYCHFTSPIRRYPDLIAHRIIVSTLIDKEQSPYTAEQIDNIAGHINQLVDVQKQDTKEYMKQNAVTNAATSIKTGDKKNLSNMPPSERKNLIKYVTESGEMTDTLADVLLVQMKSLDREDFLRILTAPYNDGRWPDLKKAIVSCIAEKPSDTVDLLNMAKQKSRLTSYRIMSSRVGGPAHQPVFSAQVIAKIDDTGEVSTTEAVTGIGKTNAEQQAAILFWQQYSEAALVPPHETIQPQMVDVTEKKIVSNKTNPSDAKSQLNMLCQKNQWGSPEYQEEKNGPDDKPQFQCIVIVKGESAIGQIAYNKKSAEQNAAQALLHIFTVNEIDKVLSDVPHNTLKKGLQQVKSALSLCNQTALKAAAECCKKAMSGLNLGEELSSLLTELLIDIAPDSPSKGAIIKK